MGKIGKKFNDFIDSAFVLLPYVLLISLMLMPFSCGAFYSTSKWLYPHAMTDKRCIIALGISLLATFIIGMAGSVMLQKIRKKSVKLNQVMNSSIVGGIIFLIIWLALPNLDVCMMDRGKAMRTMANIKTIAQIIEEEKCARGEYPEAKTMSDIVPLAPEMKPSIGNIQDGWGNSLAISSSKEGYWIISPGGDGKLDVLLFDQYPTSKLIWPDSDFVYHNGIWIQNPFLDNEMKSGFR